MSHAQSLRIARHLRLRLDEAKTIWHELLGNIFSSYRPELHYMRGPGPKWRAKHRHEFGFTILPTIVRLRRVPAGISGWPSWGIVPGVRGYLVIPRLRAALAA
jgi:hypothetical protein